MSYLNCLACKEAGTKPKRGKLPNVIYDPRVKMAGTPTIEGTRHSVELAATRVYRWGIRDFNVTKWDIPHDALLVACWWAGTYGPRKFRKAWGEWAAIAGQHLWYGCVRIPDPPTEGQLG